MKTGPEALAAAPPLREVIARHGLDARKSFAQHFLLDVNLTRRIAAAAGDLRDTDVIEIGPGPGGLTRALLGTPARRVIAIEIDRRCLAALTELAELHPGRLELVEGDALRLDPVALSHEPRHVVANLPYNVGTRLLVDWLKNGDAYGGFTLMFQREVANRLTARPGTKDYGRLSVLAQWRCQVTRLFDVDRRAFTPPPKVTSAVVRLEPIGLPGDAPSWTAMSRVTAAGFTQRRKMLRSSLRGLSVPVESLLHDAGLAPELRADAVDVTGWTRLARAMEAMSA